MCGRYSLAAHPDDLRAEFGLSALPADYSARYNVAPSQLVLAVVRDNGRPRCVWLRWGLVPWWAEDVRTGQRMINARAETIASKPAFREAFLRQRCLVLADGFYEWQRRGSEKVPFRIRRSDGRPFAFAGIWARRGHDREPLETCAIVTTPARGIMARIHDRMPALLDGVQGAAWLAADAAANELHALLRPAPDDLLEAYVVSPLVNSPRNDVPACIAPV